MTRAYCSVKQEQLGRSERKEIQLSTLVSDIQPWPHERRKSDETARVKRRGQVCDVGM